MPTRTIIAYSVTNQSLLVEKGIACLQNYIFVIIRYGYGWFCSATMTEYDRTHKLFTALSRSSNKIVEEL